MTVSKTKRKADNTVRIKFASSQRVAKPLLDRSLEPGYIEDVWSAVCAASLAELNTVNAKLNEAAKRPSAQEKARIKANLDILSLSTLAGPTTNRFMVLAAQMAKGDALVVANASVDKSITMKRFKTGQGYRNRILKPFSRIGIIVRDEGDGELDLA